MGITVTSINKQGNKVINYTCDLNGNKLILDKEQLIQRIKNKEVDNARIQIYKDQVIIRVKTDSDDKNIKKERKSSGKKHKKEQDVSSRELMVTIAKEFNINNIMPYMERFFEKNPTLRNKNYTSENIKEKIEDMKKIISFWRLVAYKQIEQAAFKLSEQVSDMEYTQYCKDNNIEYIED